MKIPTKNLLVIILFLNIQLINAQDDEDGNFYLSTEFNRGNYIGINFDLNYIFKNNYSLKLGFSGNIREPESQPEDFSSGLTGLLSFGTDFPLDHLLTYRIDVGKIYNLNKKGTIRANLSVGLGYTIIKEPGNWQKIDSESVIILTENYTYSYNSYDTVSLIINPKIEFPISKFFGFSVSPMLQVNKDRTYYGIGIGSLIGNLK